MNDLELSPFILSVVLPLFRALYRKSGVVRTGQLATALGYCRRTVYNWLRAMQEVGLVKLTGKRWVMVEAK